MDSKSTGETTNQHSLLIPVNHWCELLIPVNHWCELLIKKNAIQLHARKLTKQWKTIHLKMYLLLKMVNVHCHVSFQGGKSRNNMGTPILEEGGTFWKTSISRFQCEFFGGVTTQPMGASKGVSGRSTWRLPRKSR